jgi:hypothetical protein
MNFCYDSATSLTIPNGECLIFCPHGKITAVTGVMYPAKGRIFSIKVVAPNVDSLKVYVLDAVQTADQATLATITPTVAEAGFSRTYGVGSAPIAVPAELYAANLWLIDLLDVDLANAQDGAGLAVTTSTYIPVGKPDSGVSCDHGMVVVLKNVSGAEFTGIVNVTIVFDTNYEVGTARQVAPTRTI